MKVKLLKKIRSRFCVVPESNEKDSLFFYKCVVYDSKTGIEYNVYGDIIEQSIAQICFCLDNPLFKYSSWYEKKIEKRSSSALKRKYFHFMTK